MKYMLLLYTAENSWTREEIAQCMESSSALCDELAAKGQYFASSGLHPVATAISVRVRDGKWLVTTGPYAETTEQLGGYFIIDVPNLDDAIAVASRLTSAKKGAIEIRPVFELEGLPTSKYPAADDGKMRVMLLCYDDEAFWQKPNADVHRAGVREAVELTHRMDARGQYCAASPLHPSSTATTVRVREGKRIVTDGPFAETHEILGGYYIASVNKLEDAIDIAAQHPGARVGTVELRQIYELPVDQPATSLEISR